MQTNTVISSNVANFSSLNNVRHLDVTAIDVNPIELAKFPLWASLQSLNLSRLEIDDKFMCDFLERAQLQELRWLDVSSNQAITLTTVTKIAELVKAKQLPKLMWLDLLGTQCDATPYIDGYRWRISEAAESLASRFGYQDWMMLGTRQASAQNCELLSQAERITPLDRFAL